MDANHFQAATRSDILVPSVPILQCQCFYRSRYENIFGVLQREIQGKKQYPWALGAHITKTRSLNRDLQGRKERSKVWDLNTLKTLGPKHSWWFMPHDGLCRNNLHPHSLSLYLITSSILMFCINPKGWTKKGHKFQTYPMEEETMELIRCYILLIFGDIFPYGRA